ncbi:hypothetical protein TNIN_288771, partial [Trichonephila inaurata madagascariensis]
RVRPNGISLRDKLDSDFLHECQCSLVNEFALYAACWTAPFGKATNSLPVLMFKILPTPFSLVRNGFKLTGKGLVDTRDPWDVYDL